MKPGLWHLHWNRNGVLSWPCSVWCLPNETSSTQRIDLRIPSQLQQWRPWQSKCLQQHQQSSSRLEDRRINDHGQIPRCLCFPLGESERKAGLIKHPHQSVALYPGPWITKARREHMLGLRWPRANPGWSKSGPEYSLLSSEKKMWLSLAASSDCWCFQGNALIWTVWNEW